MASDLTLTVPIQAGTRSLVFQHEPTCWYVFVGKRTYYALHNDGRIERVYLSPNEGPSIMEIKPDGL